MPTDPTNDRAQVQVAKQGSGNGGMEQSASADLEQKVQTPRSARKKKAMSVIQPSFHESKADSPRKEAYVPGSAIMAAFGSGSLSRNRKHHSFIGPAQIAPDSPSEAVAKRQAFRAAAVEVVDGGDGVVAAMVVEPSLGSAGVEVASTGGVVSSKIKQKIEQLKSGKDPKPLPLKTLMREGSEHSHLASIELLTDRAIAKKNKLYFEQSSEANSRQPSRPSSRAVSRSGTSTSVPDLAGAGDEESPVPSALPEPVPIIMRDAPAPTNHRRSSTSPIPMGSQPIYPKAESPESASNDVITPKSTALGSNKALNRLSKSVEFFGFGAKSKKAAKPEDADMSPKTDTATTTGATGSQPALNSSGSAVGMRKKKGANSNMSLNSTLSAGAQSTASIDSVAERGAAGTPSGGNGGAGGGSPVGMLHSSTARRSSKNFKEWYSHFLQESLRRVENHITETEFPDYISLATVFGKKAAAIDTADRILWSDQPRNDIIKYRILNVFKDTKLDTVQYDATNAAGVEFITSGKPLDLLDALIFPLNQDQSYAEVFLATYRFFMPSSKVLDGLIEWYNVDVDEDCTPTEEQFLKRNRKYIQARAAKILLMWIKNHWQDFHDDKPLLAELMGFVEQRLSWYTTQYIPPFSNKRTSLIQELNKPWAMQWEPAEFAIQLTLLDHFHFRQVRPDSYLHVLQSPVPRVGGAQNVALKVILEYVYWFKLVSSYAASLIMREDTPRKKAHAIKKLIKIAKETRGLNNYNTTFALMQGLKRPAVARLNQAWEQISSKHLDTFRDLDALMDPTGGHANYWSELKLVRPPAIPYFAAYIHDLVEINDETPTFLTDAPDLPPPSPTKTIDSTVSAVTNDTFTSSNTSAGHSSAFTPSSYTASVDEPNMFRVVNFQKYYDLYSIVAEMELFRNTGYRELVGPNGEQDQSTTVLNHIKNWAAAYMVDDAVLDNMEGGVWQQALQGEGRNRAGGSSGAVASPTTLNRIR
ncbi:hypothetical protein HK102_010489 [Quaeritorhiza haematococci]|nr:hypothetical protein HK102_010489 [Quaeritorhiza haematococci]